MKFFKPGDVVRVINSQGIVDPPDGTIGIIVGGLYDDMFTYLVKFPNWFYGIPISKTNVFDFECSRLLYTFSRRRSDRRRIYTVMHYTQLKRSNIKILNGRFL